MQEESDILARVRRTAAMRILFLPHAVQQMLRPDRMIRRVEVRLAIERGSSGSVGPDCLSNWERHLLVPWDGWPLVIADVLLNPES